MNKDTVTESLRRFVERRDDLLHEDGSGFNLHLSRFMELCEGDDLLQSVLRPIMNKFLPDVDSWWKKLSDRKVEFPPNSDEEFALRYSILQSVNAEPDKVFSFTFAFGKRKRDEGIELFRSIVLRPFTTELTNRVSIAANIVSPEERALQAVPLSRIPSAAETRIFLSHKSIDKPIVERYYSALKALGFEPWLDEPDMPAGTNLERGILEGFEKSCAAVFFITANFKDEKYLASEVDYAIIQKRNKGKKFAIITLRYPSALPVPGLLTPYIFKDVENDLDGFYQLVRALPIELGQTRWKKEVSLMKYSRWDEVRRAQLRGELHAYYARLYGLTRDELRYILDPKEVHGEDFPGETFRVVKEKEIKQFGEYRTRRLVLEAWDKMVNDEV